MANNLKEPLLSMLNDFENISNKMRKEIKEVCAELKKKDTIIPANSQGKSQLCQFILLLFFKDPGLMTNKNKERLYQFAEEIELTPTNEKRTRKKP